MKDVFRRFLVPLFIALVCYGFSGCGPNPQAGSVAPSNPSPKTEAAPAQQDIAKQQKDAEQRARPDIEERRKLEQQEAEKNLDKEAISAINETQAAVKAIASGNHDEAISALQKASGTINILLARYPNAALIPVSAEVEVIDLAPQDMDAIRTVTDAVETEVRAKDYPTARLLLHGLTSEIRVRTTNLPLAKYSDAIRQAARLVDQNKTKEASAVLMMALNTLTIVDRSDPLPLLLAEKDVGDAQAVRDKNKDLAMNLLEDSKRQLERAKELGYAGNDPEYSALNKSIVDLEKQLKGNGETMQAFSNLKDRIEAFFNRQSQNVRRPKQG
jgi:YfdX protein